MTRLEAKDLTLAYGDAAVVAQLTAAIPDGQITSIIGPNGCGKSTLLRALSRLMKPKGGGVVLDGEAIHRQATKSVARRLGLLPQGATAPEAVTVEDLASRGRYPHQSMFQPPTDADQRAVNRALELANMNDLRKRVIDELSGGQRQRAWIAMTLAQDTPILLLDEPTTYLDIAHQHEVLDLVRRLNREEGKTIVMVLHDINEAAHASDHIIAMRDGDIIAAGAPGDIVSPELLTQVFGIESDVIEHPVTREPVCVPRTAAVSALDERRDGEPRLRAEHLSLGYGKRMVAEDLTVAFPEGAITAIIGPNACGKTTLLRSLARLLGPKAGSAYLDGTPVQQGRRREFSRRLTFLTQSPTAPPEVSVEQLVAAGRFPYQRWWRQWCKQDEEIVEAALHATGIEGLRDRGVDTLSGGQRQRAWIAMALAQDTCVMILDEPTTFLDIAHQVEVLDLVRRLNREQRRTVVMVLHDLHQACRYADNVVAMKDGRIVVTGDPRVVMTADRVREVFGVESEVVPDPVTGVPLVMPVPAGARAGAGERGGPLPRMELAAVAGVAP